MVLRIYPPSCKHLEASYCNRGIWYGGVPTHWYDIIRVALLTRRHKMVKSWMSHEVILHCGRRCRWCLCTSLVPRQHCGRRTSRQTIVD